MAMTLRVERIEEQSRKIDAENESVRVKNITALSMNCSLRKRSAKAT